MTIFKKILFLILTANSLYLFTGLSACVTIFLISDWSNLPALQKLVGLFLISLTLHEWEALRFPGGLIDVIVDNIRLPILNLETAKFVLFFLIIILTFIPLFFPKIAWLALSSMAFGFIQLFPHLMLIKLKNHKYFYTPGFLTVILLILPISIYGITYIISNDLLQPIHWVYSIIYLIVSVLIAQRMIARSNGIKYSDFLKQVHVLLFKMS